MAALRKGTIQAAGLDVFWNEPTINPEWMSVPNVTLFPHVGSGSVHTRDGMGQLLVDNLVGYTKGIAPKSPVDETPFKGW
jgi:lactate dehydrogenase-like 2-hydroxyacid dehydrogenase